MTKTKAEKLERLKNALKTNDDCKKHNRKTTPKEYLYDLIESLYMGIDTYLTNYIDAIESMTEDEFQKFQQYQNKKYQ